MRKKRKERERERGHRGIKTSKQEDVYYRIVGPGRSGEGFAFPDEKAREYGSPHRVTEKT